jgi:hypothetical protein
MHERLDEKSKSHDLPSHSLGSDSTVAAGSCLGSLALKSSSFKPDPIATRLPDTLDLRPRPSSSCITPNTPFPTPTTPLFRSGLPKPFDFPGLDVLPPARLYSNEQEPSSKNVPSQKTSMCRRSMRGNFLRVNFGHGTWIPVRPGTAARRL